MSAPSGEDISIGSAWRASMMANSARDPYWQAAVRREVMDHPTAQAEIEDTCATCHMPMARVHRRDGALGFGIRELERAADEAERALAHDGVSCNVCHQIRADNLGAAASFSGGFVIRAAAVASTPSDVWTFPRGSRTTTSNAIRDQFRPDAVIAYSTIGAVRNVSHAVHQRAECRGRRNRSPPRAGPVPRVATQ